MPLSNKKILLGISGGIAAYKCVELVSLLKKKGCEVKVVATENALRFVSKLSLETLSMNKIYHNVFEEVPEYLVEHIALVAWADVLLIAPATADIIGKMAHGIAGDALSTTYLAFNKQVFLAPSMNTNMYKHPAVQENMKILSSRGVVTIEPTVGQLACGVVGKGRMEEPVEIVRFLDDFFADTLKKKS
jgi:phosphopantothenoylcysteine decarboxylase/phosphopantothenate--cysteine ligase